MIVNHHQRYSICLLIYLVHFTLTFTKTWTLNISEQLYIFIYPNNNISTH